MPMTGMSLITVEMVMVCRVPYTGIKNVWTMRNVPPARPGMAANQNSCSVVKVNPMPGSLITMALIMNHVAKDRMSAMVVIVKVRHAIRLPWSRQKSGSSGVHFSIQVAMVVVGLVVLF